MIIWECIDFVTYPCLLLLRVNLCVLTYTINRLGNAVSGRFCVLIILPDSHIKAVVSPTEGKCSTLIRKTRWKYVMPDIYYPKWLSLFSLSRYLLFRDALVGSLVFNDQRFTRTARDESEKGEPFRLSVLSADLGCKQSMKCGEWRRSQDCYQELSRVVCFTYLSSS